MAVRRYSYPMKHTWVTTTEFGILVPIFNQEVTPGDSWAGVSNILVRVSALDLPAFISGSIHAYFFFVPYRLVWDQWEDFITGTTSPVVPTITVTNSIEDTFLEDLGIGPAAASATYDINALPVRCFNLVWNEFFRDQKVDAPRTLDDITRRQSRFQTGDYFARARSEIQQGPEETVDVSGGTLSVTALRDAQHRQRFRERRSQFGERYTDYLAAMGLRVPDSRLDRPEHVARGRGMLGISEVVATATSANENTGQYRGHGISGMAVPFRKRMFLEHGCLLGYLTVRPRNQMRRKTDKQWMLAAKDDWFQQELARDTQVELVMGEVRAQSDDPKSVVGYLPRDEWLRTPRDNVAGRMQRDTYAGWGATRFFGSDPDLASILAVPQYNFLFQDQAEPTLFVYCSHNIGKRSLVPRSDK